MREQSDLGGVTAEAPSTSAASLAQLKEANATAAEQARRSLKLVYSVNASAGLVSLPCSELLRRAIEVETALAEDEAKVTAAAAEPLPEGSSWLELGGAELEPLFASTTVIDVSWLLRFARGEVMPECGGVVPAWQQLPDEAKVDLSQLRQAELPSDALTESLNVAVLSYGWASSEHPDPTGEQLRQMVPALEALVFTSRKEALGGPYKWGLVWDYMSLPQRLQKHNPAAMNERDGRSAYELARFRAGLESINVWYGHPRVTTLVCDWPMPSDSQNGLPIDRRGWCIFEKSLSTCTKASGCFLALSKLGLRDEGKAIDRPQALRGICAGQGGPLTPEAFASYLRDGMAREEESPGSGFRFTNGKDATDVCIPQYEQGFLQRISSANALCFPRCGWRDRDVKALIDALKYASKHGTTAPTKELDLRSQGITQRVAVTRGQAVPGRQSGDQEEDGVDDAASLAPLTDPPKAGGLTDASVPLLVDALVNGLLPELTALRLDQNPITDKDGARQALETARPGLVVSV